MKVLNNLFLFACFVFTVCTCGAFVRAESETKLKLEGLFHAQAGFRSQDNLNDNEKNVSSNKSGGALFTEATIAATIAQTVNGINYGAKLVLVPTTKMKLSSSYNGSHIFVESDYGKVELGSPIDAGSKMMIGAYDIAAATGDDWTKYAKFDGVSLLYRGLPPEFATVYGDGFFDYKTSVKQVHDGAEPARVISYFSPKISGIQFGISYVPDTSNSGGTSFEVANNSQVQTIAFSDATIKQVDFNSNVKDAVTGGISYENTISDGVDFKVSVNAQYANVSNSRNTVAKVTYVDASTPQASLKLSNMRGYNIGGVLNYGNMSYNLAYASLGNNLTNAEYHKNGRDTSYYGGAVAYNQGPLKLSLSYFNSTKYKNKLNFISVGTQYKVLPGLAPYVEVSHFTGSGKPVFYPNADIKKIKGTIALIGAKLSF